MGTLRDAVYESRHPRSTPLTFPGGLTTPATESFPRLRRRQVARAREPALQSRVAGAQPQHAAAHGAGRGSERASLPEVGVLPHGTATAQRRRALVLELAGQPPEVAAERPVEPQPAGARLRGARPGAQRAGLQIDAQRHRRRSRLDEHDARLGARAEARRLAALEHRDRLDLGGGDRRQVGRT